MISDVFIAFAGSGLLIAAIIIIVAHVSARRLDRKYGVDPD